MRKKLEIINVEGRNYLVVDNEAFDWEVEPDQIKAIKLKIKNDPLMKDSLIGSVFGHMESCFSEFIGRKITLKEINDSIECGYIEV
jgi:hypothetical protein